MIDNVGPFPLLTNRRLSGARRVSLTVRPLRLACLVHPTDPMPAIAAIQLTCRLWGGMFHMLFPCGGGEEPAPVWQEILEAYDPDAVIDFVGVSQGYLEFQSHERDRIVQTDASRPDLEAVVGAPLFAALHRWRRLRSPTDRPVTVKFDLPDDHRLKLPLAFRYGQIGPPTPPVGMRIYSPYLLARLDEYLQVHEAMRSDTPEDKLIRYATATPVDRTDLLQTTDYVTRLYPLPQLTCLGLHPLEPPHHGDPIPPERRQYDESYLHRLLVVGDPRSVPDLCLAWNLRAQRRADRPLPLWVAPDWLLLDDVKCDIDLATTRAGKAVFERPGRIVLHLVSASLTRDELQRLPAANMGDIDRVETHCRSELARLFTDAFRTNPPYETTAYFSSRGAAEVQIPDYAELADFGPSDRIGWTLRIGGYVPPRLPHEHLHHFGPVSRIASDGIAWFSMPDTEPPQGLHQIGTRSGWEIVQALAEHAGYTAEYSDKGRLTTRILKLLGGQLGLAIIASSLVYNLIRKMAQVVSRQAIQQQVRYVVGETLGPSQIDAVATRIIDEVLAKGQFELQHPGWSELKRDLGGLNGSQSVIDWLVRHRVLLRGYQFICSNCRIKRWYPVDHLAEKVTCEGCLETIPLPAQIESLQWRYKLNELVAHAVDQGVVVHLLAARRLAELAGHDDNESDFLGYYPGVRFVPTQRADPSHREIEVDFLAIAAGRPIIAEMKATGSELTERAVDDLSTLAKILECSRIIFGSPDGFPDSRPVIERAQRNGAPIAVDVWGEDLLDPPRQPGEARLCPKEYLHSLVGWISSDLLSDPEMRR